MMKEIKINKALEDELDKQFPKGDKARGKALVLNAVANIEIDKSREEIFNKIIEMANKNFPCFLAVSHGYNCPLIQMLIEMKKENMEENENNKTENEQETQS